MKTRLFLAAALAAVAVSASARSEWPFIVIRHTGAINARPDVFEKLIDCHRRHRGACDEFWFAAGGRNTPDAVAKSCAEFARFRPLCEEVGIALSYQQGLTLGHGEAHDGKPKPGEQTFSGDVWQVDQNGNAIHFLCPRSPEVLAYERAYAKAVMKTAQPASYWLDDDLRLGVCKPQGCFCDRCIAAFNAKTGGNWTRETLAAKLFSGGAREPVRREWLDFNAEALAVYAAEVRKAADELKSPCRLAYQSVWSDSVYTASSYRPLLEALSGPARQRVGIRPGAGYYAEAEPRGMVKKCLSVAREAERCRDYGGIVASVCYEQETYPRHVLHKSPGAIMTECALALASGCDSISLYWYSQSDPEPVEEYDRFVRTLAGARPYFERLAESTRRTRLGGVARFLGSAALETADFDLADAKDFDLAAAGVPVTVAEANPKAWYLTAKSRAALTDADKATLAAGGVVKVDDIAKYPLASRRKKLLDDLRRDRRELPSPHRCHARVANPAARPGRRHARQRDDPQPLHRRHGRAEGARAQSSVGKRGNSGREGWPGADCNGTRRCRKRARRHDPEPRGLADRDGVPVMGWRLAGQAANPLRQWYARSARLGSGLWGRCMASSVVSPRRPQGRRSRPAASRAALRLSSQPASPCT